MDGIKEGMEERLLDPEFKRLASLAKKPKIFRPNIKPDIAADAHLIAGHKDNPSLLCELLNYLEESPEPLPMGNLIEVHSKNKQAVSPERYSLIRDSGKGDSNRFKHFNYDAPYSILLSYADFPVAALAFEAKDSAIRIKQIQGAKFLHEPLKDILWTFVLLDYTLRWASSFGIPSVEVISHKLSPWPQVCNTNEGFQIYDLTSKRRGFSYDPASRIYTKKLEQLAVPNPQGLYGERRMPAHGK